MAPKRTTPSVKAARQQWLATNGNDPSKDEKNKQETIASLERFLEGKYLLGLYPATDIAELAFLITRAGVSSALLGAMSTDPLQPSFVNNASRQVAKALEISGFEEQLYLASIPLYDVDEDRRVVGQLPMRLPHEVVRDDFARHQGAWKSAAAVLDTANWNGHAVRQKDHQNTFPIGLFSDSISVTKNESLAVWLLNTVGERKRFTLAVCRKSETCGLKAQCPCRGRRTYSAIERVLAWSLQALAAGIHPTTREDGTCFEDVKRIQKAGTPLGVRGALVEFRADWVQYCQSFGFGGHSSAQPCFKCAVGRPEMFNFAAEETWVERSHTDYLACCVRSVLPVQVSVADVGKIWDCLHMDFAKKRAQRTYRGYPSLHSGCQHGPADSTAKR
jgi:hypothetical protein